VVVEVPRGAPAVGRLAAAVACSATAPPTDVHAGLPWTAPQRPRRATVIETLFNAGATGGIRQGPVRRVAAEALADQVALLEELLGERSGTAAALTDPPAWARSLLNKGCGAGCVAAVCGALRSAPRMR
jgi:hypothetical protein